MFIDLQGGGAPDMEPLSEPTERVVSIPGGVTRRPRGCRRRPWVLETTEEVDKRRRKKRRLRRRVREGGQEVYLSEDALSGAEPSAREGDRMEAWARGRQRASAQQKQLGSRECECRNEPCICWSWTMSVCASVPQSIRTGL